MRQNIYGMLKISSLHFCIIILVIQGVSLQKELNIIDYEVLRLSGNGDSYGKLIATWIE